MRIAILCNDRIALPAIDQLFSAKLVVATGMSEHVNETTTIVRNKCGQYKVPFQLFNKKDFSSQIMHWLDEHQPDVVLVKTFPHLVPAEAITVPKHGFINFHYAPLPEWRGPSPLFWMIRNQVTQGGVTIHRMNASFDAGPVLLQQPVPCSPDQPFGLFYTQLAYTGANLTGPLLFGLSQGKLQEKEQDHSQAKWYRRPQPSDLFIDWNAMNAYEVKALVRACNPWYKGAATRWKGWTFGIVYASVIEDSITDAEPGTILSIDDQFVIACKDGKKLKAEIAYCEEGFYPGHCIKIFGLQKNDRLSQ